MATDIRHTYQVSVEWTGNQGTGTSGYRAYGRDHLISVGDKPAIPGSSDPVYRGDTGRYNPEELLVASLSGCHMLWYLHLCADAGIVVESYQDDATGVMAVGVDGGGRFTEVTLKPRVRVADPGLRQKAMALHEEAHRLCFIAGSVNFPVLCEAEVTG